MYSARALKKKKHVLWCWYCGKKTNWYVFYRGLYSYRQRLRVITLFPNIFSYCFCMLSEFVKGFERKVWRVQVAHLHNAARALSSLSRCFQLSTNLDKDFFRYLLHCRKKQIECRLAWHWWNSTDLGLCINWYVFLPLRMQKSLLVYYYSENRTTTRIWNVLPNVVFPPIWREKMVAFWACACKLSLTLVSPARVQPLYGAGRKESSGTGLGVNMHHHLPYGVQHDLNNGSEPWDDCFCRVHAQLSSNMPFKHTVGCTIWRK